MQRIPLATQFYALQSAAANSEDLLNLYVEQLPQEGRSDVIVRSTPGLSLDMTVGTGPGLAMDGTLPGILYFVSGTHAYRVAFGATTTVTDLGSIGSVPAGYSTGNPAKIVTIAIGVLAVVICNPPNAYQCLHTATAITQITDPNFPGADSVAYLDGFFAFSLGDQLFTSNLLDAATFSALNFAYADSVPNVIQRVITLERDLWMMGYAGIEVFGDAGTANFPFAPRSGGTIQQGCRNPACTVICSNILFWLGTDGIVYQNQGYQAKRVSTFALEEWMRLHADYENVDAFGYTQSGHWFYALNFYGAGSTVAATFVYDLNTQKWHRRASSVDGTGSYRAMRATQLGNIALISDRTTGQIFQLDPNTPQDAGVQVLRQAVLPPLYAKTHRGFMPRLELEMEIGDALTNPAVVLDYSDDGGYTYSGQKIATAQLDPVRIGRVFWTRLGSFRQRVLRFSFRDRVSLYAADAELTEGTS